jgi:hypothetical protein
MAELEQEFAGGDNGIGDVDDDDDDDDEEEEEEEEENDETDVKEDVFEAESRDELVA